MFRVLPLLIACLLPAVASAQISMEDEYRPHAKIVAEYQWTPQADQSVSVLWIPPEEIEFEAFDERIFIWAAPSERHYSIIAVITTSHLGTETRADGTEFEYVKRTSKSFERVKFFVRDSTPPDPRPPDPDKPDPPDPDPDDPNFYGLQSRSETWALQVPLSHRQQAIDGLIANFATAAKSTATPTTMLANLRDANRKVLPDPSAVRTAWLPFFENWGNYVAGLSQDGTLSNLTSAHQKIFAETRRGLEAARSQ